MKRQAFQVALAATAQMEVQLSQFVDPLPEPTLQTRRELPLLKKKVGKFIGQPIDPSSFMSGPATTPPWQ